MRHATDLSGRVAIVTGANSGIGRGIALELAAAGAKVVVNHRPNDDSTRRGLEVVDEIARAGGVAVAAAADISREDDVAQLFRAAHDHFQGVDILVNNAGIEQPAPIQDMTLAQWQKVIDVNLTGTFLGMQHSVEAMKAAGGGSIINISSIEGLRGAVMVHPYVASKWAVRGLTKSAALELGPHNIRVNSVHPGFIRTPMTKHFPDNMLRIPLGRPGQPDEVATFVVFLASDESRYSTGAEYVMDGGLTLDVPHK